MSAKSPWNTHAVVGIFYPRPFFAAKITIVSPLPPLYNVESIAEALSYLERHNFLLQCYLYHLHTTLFYGGRDFIVRLQHKSQEVFQDFWQTLQVLIHKILNSDFDRQALQKIYDILSHFQEKVLKITLYIQNANGKI